MFNFFAVFYFSFFSISVVAQSSNPNCVDCQPLAQIRVSDSGLSKLIEKSVDANIDQINKQIIAQGKLNEQIWKPASDCQYKNIENKNTKEDFVKCPFITDYDSETGAVSISGKKHPLQSSFSRGQINNIKLELVKPIQCLNLKCHIAVKVTQLDVSGKLRVQQLDSKTDLIPNKNISFKMNDDAKPLLYEFDAAINQNTGKLEELGRVVPGSTLLKVPEGALALNVEEKDFKNAEELRKAELNEVYQRVRATLGEYKNRTVLDDELRVAKANLYFAKTQGMSQLSPQQQKLIDSQINKELSTSDVYKTASIKLPDTSDPDQQAKALRNIPPSFFTLPKLADAMDQSEYHARAKLNGYPNTGAYVLSRSAAVATNLALSNSFFVDAITNNFSDRFEGINEEINSSFANLPYFIDQIAAVPKINSQLLVNMNQVTDKIQELEKKINDKSYSASERAGFREELKTAIEDYRQLDAQVSNDANFMKLQTQMVVDKVANANKVVGMSLYPTQKNCDPKPLPAKNGKANYDVATEVSVDGLNQYFQKLQEGGDLNFCTKATKNGDCKGGQLIKFSEAPVVKFDPTTGLHKVYIKTEVGRHGSVVTEFNTKFIQCGNSPCLELSNAKSSAKSLSLKIVGAGYMTEKTIMSANEILGKQDTLSVPIANLKAVTTNPENGAVNFEWELK